MNLAKRVARGAEALDMSLPGWWANIELARLDQADPDLCVIGQQGGSYSYNIGQLAKDAEYEDTFKFAWKHGFDLDDDDQAPAVFRELTGLWTQAVVERLQAAAHGDFLAPEQSRTFDLSPNECDFGVLTGLMQDIMGHLGQGTTVVIRPL